MRVTKTEKLTAKLYKKAVLWFELCFPENQMWSQTWVSMSVILVLEIERQKDHIFEDSNSPKQS